MEWIECSTQAEMDAAVKAGNGAIVRKGDFTAYDNSTVRASGNSTVVVSGNSTVWAYDNSTVWAYDNSTVRAYDNSTVWAGRSVAVHVFSADCKVRGGVKIRPYRPVTPAEWCREYHVKVSRGVATVYKAVRHDFKSARGVDYTPGTVPVASDWDGGEAECGGGLHFSPTPAMALAFDPKATRFLECRVALADMRTAKSKDIYPYKCKARGCCRPVRECDRNGKLLEGGAK